MAAGVLDRRSRPSRRRATAAIRRIGHARATTRAPQCRPTWCSKVSTIESARRVRRAPSRPAAIRSAQRLRSAVRHLCSCSSSRGVRYGARPGTSCPEARCIPARIDVHYHMLKSGCRGDPHKAGGHWSPCSNGPGLDRQHGSQRHFDRDLSIRTSGVWWGDVDAARKLSLAEQYAAQLVRVILTVSVSLRPCRCDVDGSIAGAYTSTSSVPTGSGAVCMRYVAGDPRFEPVFAGSTGAKRRRTFIRRSRGAVRASCRRSRSRRSSTSSTTRAITNLLFTGTFASSGRALSSHGGGTIPFLAGRIDIAHSNRASKRRSWRRQVHAAPAALRTRHIDERTSARRNAMPPEQLLLGSDYPYVGAEPFSRVWRRRRSIRTNAA